MQTSENVETEKTCQIITKLIDMNFGQVNKVDGNALLVESFDGFTEVVVDVVGRTVTTVKGDAEAAKRLEDLIKSV